MFATCLASVILGAYPVTKLHVNVYTGNDDLREGSEAFLLYSVRGESKEARLNPRGERWGDQTWSNTVVDVDPLVEDADIRINGIRFVAGRREHMNDDQWEMHGLRVTAEDRSRTQRILYRNEAVRHKFTRSGSWRIRTDPRFTRDPVAPRTEPDYFEFELFTGRDDLRRNSAVHATFIFSHQYAVTEYIRGPIAGGGSKKNRIRLPALPEAKLWRIELMMVEEGRSATDTLDHWDFDGIRVDLPGTENDYHNTTRRQRLAAGDVSRSPIIGSYGVQQDPQVQGLYVTILTGDDDLKPSSSALIRISGPRGEYTKEIRGLKPRNRSFHYVPASGIRVSEISRITINPVTMVSDGWTLKGLSVEAAVGPGPAMRVFEDWEIGQSIDRDHRWQSPDFRR